MIEDYTFILNFVKVFLVLNSLILILATIALYKFCRTMEILCEECISSSAEEEQFLDELESILLEHKPGDVAAFVRSLSRAPKFRI